MFYTLMPIIIHIGLDPNRFESTLSPQILINDPLQYETTLGPPFEHERNSDMNANKMNNVETKQMWHGRVMLLMVA